MDCLVIFNFHQVSPTFKPKLHCPGTWTSLGNFESNLRYIQRHFQLAPLHILVERMEQGAIKGPNAAITFDDGDISIKEHVIPLLESYSAPATFFINTAYLDNKKAPWFLVMNYLIQAGKKDLIPKDLLDIASDLRWLTDGDAYRHYTEQIEKLSKFVEAKFFIDSVDLHNVNSDLFQIGLHGHEHLKFSTLSYQEQRDNIQSNIKQLQKLNNYVPIMAIPFGRPSDWNNDTIQACLELDLKILFANGGVNIDKEVGFKRLPTSNRDLQTQVNENILHIV